jgi:hypothetical protein
MCQNEGSVCDVLRSRSRHAVILGIGCSLGAGPSQCNLFAPWNPGPGWGSELPPPTPPPPTPPPTSTSRPPAAPPIATTPRREEPTRRETLGPKKPPPSSRAVIPEGVIMTAVRALQPTLIACWRRAQRNDPSLTSARVRLSLEVDAAGAVTSARTDAEDARLSACLANVARKLTFPAPGRPAAFDVPLHF